MGGVTAIEHHRRRTSLLVRVLLVQIRPPAITAALSPCQSPGFLSHPSLAAELLLWAVTLELWPLLLLSGDLG